MPQALGTYLSENVHIDGHGMRNGGEIRPQDLETAGCHYFDQCIHSQEALPERPPDAGACRRRSVPDPVSLVELIEFFFFTLKKLSP